MVTVPVVLLVIVGLLFVLPPLLRLRIARLRVASLIVQLSRPLDFGKDENGNDLPKTIISREYSSEWKPGDEPYYPVNDAKNGALYAEYKKLADAEPKVIFGGRLGEYKYYDMDQVIAAVLDRCESELH